MLQTVARAADNSIFPFPAIYTINLISPEGMRCVGFVILLALGQVLQAP
jgi:hypothetical protein